MLITSTCYPLSLLDFRSNSLCQFVDFHRFKLPIHFSSEHPNLLLLALYDRILGCDLKLDTNTRAKMDLLDLRDLNYSAYSMYAVDLP